MTELRELQDEHTGELKRRRRAEQLLEQQQQQRKVKQAPEQQDQGGLEALRQQAEDAKQQVRGSAYREVISFQTRHACLVWPLH